jgi:hypothetical protein
MTGRLNKALGMNLTDQTYAKIPEVMGAISSGQKPADIAGIYTGDLSAPGPVELSVIARIPDLDAPSPPPKHKRSSRSKSVKPASTPGRLLGAGLSLNLLIGLGLALLLGAVASSVYNQIADNTQSNSGNSIGRAWQPPPPAPTADLAPAWKPLVAQAKSSSQLGPNMAESNVKGPAPLLPADNKVAMENGKTTSDPNLNASDAANLARWDNNVVQSNITTPLLGSRANQTLAADIKSAADKRNGIIASPRPGDLDPGPVASGQSSSWPRIADDQANFSSWPNPAHPVFAAAGSRNVAASPAGLDASSTRTNALPAVANRPTAIGGAPPGRMGNPPDYRPGEQYNYPAGVAADPRRNEPFIADRRNAPAPGVAVGMPSAPPIGAPGTAQPSSANEAGRAQFDGMINSTPDRNIYELSRPSLH